MIKETIKEVKAILEDAGYKVEIKEVYKNNEKLSSLIILNEDGVNPTFYLEKMSGTPEKIAREIISMVIANSAPRPKEDFINKIQDKEYVLNHLRACVVSTKGNEEFLEPLVKVNYKDLGLTLYYRIMFKDASIVLTKAIADQIGIDKIDIENNIDLSDYKMFSIAEVIGESLKKQGTPDFVIEEMEQQNPMKIISNTEKLYGSGIIAYPSKLKEIVGMEKFYVLPSSVHEIIVLPMDGFEPNFLRKMVCDINRDEVAPSDRLSDNIFVYDGSKLLIA